VRRHKLPEDRSMIFLAYVTLVLGVIAVSIGVMTALNWWK
jgi:hypothetical protein